MWMALQVCLMDRTDYINNIRKNIEVYGRGIIGVFNNEYDDETYTHFYSIGNPRFNYLVFHPTDIGGELIHKVAKAVERHPRNYNLNSEAYVDLEGLLCDYHVEELNLPYEQLIRLRRLRGVEEQITRDRYLKGYGWKELEEYVSNTPIILMMLSDGNNRFAGEDGVMEDFNEWVPEYLYCNA